MQYLITVYDYKNNINTRLESRDEHLNNAKKLINSGKFIKAAAIMQNNIMIGSSLFVDFSTDEELELWLKNEPYVVNNVWNMSTFKKIPLKVFQG